VLYRYGNAEFQSSIRRFVPEGHTFKAFPFSAIHSNAAQLVEQCLLSPVGKDILATPGGGDLARFGVRLMVKVHALPPAAASSATHVTPAQSYAEDCLCIWLMVAVMYGLVLLLLCDVLTQYAGTGPRNKVQCCKKPMFVWLTASFMMRWCWRAVTTVTWNSSPHLRKG
jgi:hypothetical protein